MGCLDGFMLFIIYLHTESLFKMKDVKLRRVNRTKYCQKCEEMVEIVMIEQTGYCPDCKEKLYTTDTRRERLK